MFTFPANRKCGLISALPSVGEFVKEKESAVTFSLFLSFARQSQMHNNSLKKNKLYTFPRLQIYIFISISAFCILFCHEDHHLSFAPAVVRGDIVRMCRKSRAGEGERRRNNMKGIFIYDREYSHGDAYLPFGDSLAQICLQEMLVRCV